MSVFAANGIKFNFADDDNYRIPFVFQHGLGADISQPMSFFLKDHPFRFISLDCRGHGKTIPLGDRQFLRFSSFSDDIISHLDYLDLSKVVIGGISMGAAVALNFAVRHPERTQALILSRVAWVTEPLPYNLTILPRIAGLIRKHGAQRGKELFLSTCEYQTALRSSPANAASLIWQFHPFEYGQILAREIPGARFAEITAKAISEEKHVEDVCREISSLSKN